MPRSLITIDRAWERSCESRNGGAAITVMSNKSERRTIGTCTRVFKVANYRGLEMPVRDRKPAVAP